MSTKLFQNRCAWIFVLTISLFINSADAATINGLFNTGVDDSGVVLSPGTEDSHYTLTGPSTPAIAIVNHSEWMVAPAGSSWIAPTNALQTDPPGLYRYTLTFDLSGMDPSTAAISGQFASDNQSNIFLNGNNTGFSNSPAGYVSLTPFTINSGFIFGINTLEFRVTNGGGSSSNPTGLLVTDLVGEVSAIPIPAAIWLFGSGLIGLIGVARRKQSV